MKNFCDISWYLWDTVCLAVDLFHQSIDRVPPIQTVGAMGTRWAWAQSIVSTQVREGNQTLHQPGQTLKRDFQNSNDCLKTLNRRADKMCTRKCEHSYSSIGAEAFIGWQKFDKLISVPFRFSTDGRLASMANHNGIGIVWLFSELLFGVLLLWKLLQFQPKTPIIDPSSEQSFLS